jgi:hypothetical protein
LGPIFELPYVIGLVLVPTLDELSKLQQLLGVQNCDSEFLARDINSWIDDVPVEMESPQSLLDRIYES